jgi:lysophospholipase L1-like esterase
MKAARLLALILGLLLPIVAHAASISLSPSTSVATTTGSAIAVTGVGTHFTGATPALQITGGFGDALTALTVTDDTHATATISPGLPGYGNITVTDIVSGDGSPTATLTVTTPSLGTIIAGFIGTSITAGNGGTPWAVQYFASTLTGYGYTVNTTNEGANGTSTAYWIPAANNIQNAVAAFNAASPPVTVVFVELGINDMRTPNNFTAAQSAANMVLIVNYLTAQGFTVILTRDPAVAPNAQNYIGSSAAWPNNANTIMAQQWVLFSQLANGSSVFLGDTGAFEYSQIAPLSWLSTDGVHPGTASWQLLGQFWAEAYLAKFGYPAATGILTGNAGFLTGG